MKTLINLVIFVTFLCLISAKEKKQNESENEQNIRSEILKFNSQFRDNSGESLKEKGESELVNIEMILIINEVLIF